MMIHRNKKEKKEINLIPMINVIFLLLIFFMLTGVIEKKNVYIIERPYSNFAEKKSEDELNENIISVEKNGQIFLNNKTISVSELENNDIFIRNIDKITLDIDKNLELGKLKEVINILKRKNLKKIYIRSINKKNDE